MSSNLSVKRFSLWLISINGMSKGPRRAYTSAMMSVYVHRKRMKMRHVFSEERVKRESINYTLGVEPQFDPGSMFHPILTGKPPVAFRRKSLKMLNSYQVRRNIREDIHAH